MLETEKQQNRETKTEFDVPINNFPVTKKNNFSKVIFFGFLFILAGASIYFSYSRMTGKNIFKQNPESQKVSESKGKIYTKEEADAKLAELRFAQNNLPVTPVLPDNFPQEYIPVKYEKLIAVVGAPNSDNKPYGATFGVSGTVEEKYNEVKKYFIDKNWNFVELTDRKIPNDGKQIVGQFKNTTIITTVAKQNAETAITLNIISKSNGK